MPRITPLLLSLVLVAPACRGDASAQRELPLDRAPSTTEVPPPTTTTSAPAPPAAPDVPPIPTDGEVRALTTPTGVVVAVLGRDGDGYLVRTPCGASATVAGGTAHHGAHVVLDAGHGGAEPGAVGPSGASEKVVNLAIAQQAERALEESGYTVLQTRTADYRVPLQTRTELATRVDPMAFVSIHNNAEPDGPWPRPGSETYYQINDERSKRLAGLIWEETVTALEAAYPQVDWVADTDAGAKYRPNSQGGDYYGILRRAAGVPTVLAELLFMPNPREEAIVASPEGQQLLGEAVAAGIVRFLSTDDPGSGYTEPYPRSSPAGPGGGSSGCTDPPLA